MKLTPRQNAVLSAVKRLTFQAGYAPSIAELARYNGLSETRIRQHLANLVAAGAIGMEVGTARSITIGSKHADTGQN